MRIFLLSFWIAVLFSNISAQTRQEAIGKLTELKNQAAVLEKTILSPDKKDIEAASKENVGVFRLLPREVYDKGLFDVRGGGAFYSFTNKSHSYDEIPQISLEQNYLKVAFYGANYGFIADLGEAALADVSRENKYADFLISYKPKNLEPEAREEYKKIGKGFETNGLKFNKSLAAEIGHTYILRAISYDEADTLVAFKIKHKDADGSLIIFWKLLENFEKPVLIRNKQTASNNETDFTSVNYSGTKASRIEEVLRKKGFLEVKVSEEKKLIVLRGRVPKGKLAEVIQLALDTNAGKPIRNELTEN